MLIEGLRDGLLAGSDLERQIAGGEAISQDENRPDREFPEVVWNQYGIIPTNEVAVTVRCGPLIYFAKAPSSLKFPVMADRIFGTDVLDIRLGDELAEHLWAVYGAQLKANALAVRGLRDR